MTYSLHFAQHYAPEWKGGMFNRDDSSWEDLFNDKFYENGWHGENTDEYEVQRDDVKQYIREIVDKPDEKNEFFEDYTNKQVQEALEDILTSDDDEIRIEWF